MDKTYKINWINHFYSFYFHQRMHINWKHFHYLHLNHNVKSMWRVSDQ
jgi:hypothetical protein